MEADHNRFSKYRGSLAGKGSIGPCSAASSTKSSFTTELPRTSITSKDSQTASTSSVNSSLSYSQPENSRSISISESHNSRTTLRVPFVKSRNSIARSESQNRADFLLKMMAKGGDYKNYRAPSPGREKRSPTGRKISMDVKPRISPRDSIALGAVNKRQTIMESEDIDKSLSHIYVNLPDINIKENAEGDHNNQMNIIDSP